MKVAVDEVNLARTLVIATGLLGESPAYINEMLSASNNIYECELRTVNTEKTNTWNYIFKVKIENRCYIFINQWTTKNDTTHIRLAAEYITNDKTFADTGVKIANLGAFSIPMSGNDYHLVAARDYGIYVAGIMNEDYQEDMEGCSLRKLEAW